MRLSWALRICVPRGRKTCSGPFSPTHVTPPGKLSVPGALNAACQALAVAEPLPEKNRDHQLSGDYAGCRECHITPDWLLIYEVDGDELILYLTRTGSHSDLF